MKINILYKLCEILGFLPVYKNKKFIKNKIRVFVYTGILLLMYVISMYFHFTTTKRNATHSRIHAILISILYSVNFSTILNTSLFKIDALQKISDDFFKAQEKFGQFKIQTENPFSFKNSTIILINILFIIVVVFSYYYLISYGLYDGYFVPYMDNYQCYLLLLISIFEYNVLKQLAEFINKLNGLIESEEKWKLNVYGAIQLITINDLLFDIAENFGKVFGLNLFLHIILCVGYILYQFSIALFFNPIVHDKSEFTFIILLVLNLIWNGCAIFQAIILIYMCLKVVNEGRQTITASFKVLRKYSNIVHLRKKFSILANQAVARCPVFSAAGFFNVNIAVIFTFVNLIVTYIIVIIQSSQTHQ